MASDKPISRENGGNGDAGATELDTCLDSEIKKPIDSGRMARIEKRLRAKSGLSRKGLIAACVILLLLFISFIVIIVLAACWPRPPHAHQFPICRTPACLSASAQTLRMMNESAAPCEDIRAMACGSWLERHPLPPERSIWNQQEELASLARERTRELIGTLPHPTKVRSLPWKLKHFYDSCMALDNVETEKALPLRKIITQLGGWHVLRDFTMLSWEFRRVLELLHKDYGVSPFFRISVTVDGRNPKQNIIQISPAGLGLPDRSYYYRHPDDSVVAAYKRFLKDMVQLLGATSTDASQFAEEMFHFEKRIAEITPSTDELQDPATTYNRMTLHEQRQIAQSIPLQDILTAMFPMATIDDSTELLVVSKQYLSKVSMIISTTDRSALNNYVMWTFASNYLQYLSQEYADIINVYRKETTGAKAAIPRWEFCVSTLQRFMGLAVAALYEKSAYNREADRQAVSRMFEELRETMSNEVNGATWLPQELKNHIYQKVTVLSVQVGFPQFMLEDSYLESYYEKFYVQKNDFFQNIRYGVSFARDVALRRYLQPSEESRWADALLGPTVKYEPTANRIVVPLTLLQPPFFQSDYPKAVLYGSLGVRLASAMVASAGPWGVLWDSQGRLLLPEQLDLEGETDIGGNIHMQATSVQRLAHQCLLHSVVRSETREVMEIVNRTAQNVLQAANAVSLAYKTLMKFTELAPHIHIPALEYYDDDSLFFITNAQMHCSSLSNQHQDYDQAVNYHIGDTLLLRITMRQLQSFSTTFDCPSDSQLFSRKSCIQY